jgi:cysteine desulfurase/selenocysteine lyase
MAAAIDYVLSTGREDIALREKKLLSYVTERLSPIKGLKIIGTSANKISTVSFVLDGIHQYDAGLVLDKMGIAVRTGTHCAQPVMERFGIDGTIRASLCFYNTEDEIDSLAAGIEKTITMFS